MKKTDGMTDPILKADDIYRACLHETYQEIQYVSDGDGSGKVIFRSKLAVVVRGLVSRIDDQALNDDTLTNYEQGLLSGCGELIKQAFAPLFGEETQGVCPTCDAPEGWCDDATAAHQKEKGGV